MRVLHLTFVEATAEASRSIFLQHSFSGVTTFTISKLYKVNIQFLIAEIVSSLLGLNLNKSVLVNALKAGILSLLEKKPPTKPTNQPNKNPNNCRVFKLGV